MKNTQEFLTEMISGIVSQRFDGGSFQIESYQEVLFQSFILSTAMEIIIKKKKKHFELGARPFRLILICKYIIDLTLRLTLCLTLHLTVYFEGFYLQY